MACDTLHIPGRIIPNIIPCINHTTACFSLCMSNEHLPYSISVSRIHIGSSNVLVMFKYPRAPQKKHPQIYHNLPQELFIFKIQLTVRSHYYYQPKQCTVAGTSPNYHRFASPQNGYSPENQRMSPENQWLQSMYFRLKCRRFVGDKFVCFGGTPR